MIHIYSYGLEETLCTKLQATLDNAEIKSVLHTFDFSDISPDQSQRTGCELAIVDLQHRSQTSHELATHLDSIQFCLPTIVINDELNGTDDHYQLEEPIIDILAPGPVQLLVNAVRREAKLQQYNRLVTQTRNQSHSKHLRLSFILEHIEDGVAVIHEGAYLEVNPAFRRIFGIPDIEPVVGSPMQESISQTGDEIADAYSNAPLHTSIESLEFNKTHAIHIQKRNGEMLTTTLVKSKVHVLGKQAIQLIINNPDAQINVERDLLDSRSQDLDTGLLNRRFFLEQMDGMFNKRDDKTTGCFAFFLLDSFRDIRDQCGIKKGDAILQNVAETLVGLCGSDDILCRFGDHSFTLFSQQYDQSSFLQHCDCIRQRIEEHIFGSEDTYNQVTISTGISFINKHVLNTQQLISQADHACDEASEKGGNQIQVFKTLPISLHDLEDEKMQIDCIRSALKDNRLHLMYQPIVDLTNDIHENYAVLLRMVDMDGSQILPDQFIFAAEQSHLITELDQWVLGRSIEQLAADKARNIKRQLFLKVSTQSIKSEAFLDSLLSGLAFYDLNGSQIIFQVDYSEAMPEHIFVERFVKTIKEKTKCKFAFDHVGFGEITDQTIQKFSVDFIKIDGSFTRNLLNNPDFQDTIKKILEVTKRNQIAAIAKSVEDANALAAVWNMGVDMVQGYFLQRPADEMDYDFSILKD